MTAWMWRGALAVLLGGALIGVPAVGGPSAGAAAAPPAAVTAPPSTSNLAPAPTEAPPPGPGPIAPPRLAAALNAGAARPPAPVAVRIPALGVDHALVPLPTGPDGSLVPPESADVPGWFAGGAVPGEIGRAVIAGHVDSRTGPGVFFRLAELRPGDEVQVERSDGVAVFRVRVTETFDKIEFPTAGVYGPVPVPELRLITCGGAFARATGHYVANVIVRADLVRDPGAALGHEEGSTP